MTIRKLVPSTVPTSESMSRRSVVNMLVKSTTAAATVVAAAVPTGVAFPTKAAAAPDAAAMPTPIAALWKDHKRLRRKYQALCRQEDQLEAKVLDVMPKPHPSITESPENDAFGLKLLYPGHGNRLHGYIWSAIIEREIHNVMLAHYYAVVRPGVPPFDWNAPMSAPGVQEAFEWLGAHDDDPLLLPLTPEQTARVVDLRARLKLADEYEEKILRVRAELGLPGLGRSREKVVDKLSRIEGRILKLPAQTIGDTRIKLALFQRDANQFDGTDPAAESIIRDMRRMLKQQAGAQVAAA
jgi:hypothetical protein